MDRLTRERILEIQRDWKNLFRMSPADESWADEQVALCDLALQSLSQEAVRDEALEMPEDAETLEWEFEFSDTRRQVTRRVVWREDYDKLREFTIRALKREPNAAARETDSEVTSISSDRVRTPAPAAPDVAEMVKRAIKEMRFFQSVRSRVPADAQYDEWIALLAKLGQGWALDPRELKLLIDYHDTKGCEAEAMGVNGSVRYHDKRRAHYKALLPPGASDE